VRLRHPDADMGSQGTHDFFVKVLGTLLPLHPTRQGAVETVTCPCLIRDQPAAADGAARDWRKTGTHGIAVRRGNDSTRWFNSWSAAQRPIA